MTFSRDRFIAVDDECLGDGQDDAQPIGTAIQNRLAANVETLSAGVESISVCPPGNNVSLTAATGDRPWAALDWISVGLWWIPADYGFAGVDISLVYNVVAPPTATQNDVELKVVLGGTDSVQTLTNTQSGGSPSYSATTISVDLDDVVQVQAGTPIPLEIWVRSIPSGLTGESSSDQQVRGYLLDEPNAGDALYDGSSTGPDDDSTETQYADIDAGDYTDGSIVDLLGSLGSSGEDALMGGSRPHPYAGGTSTVSTGWLSYLQVRSVSVELRYEKDALARVPKDLYRPNIEFGSIASLRLVTGTRSAYSRRRVLALGPPGYLDSAIEKYSNKNYPIRWPFCMGDDTSGKDIEEIAVFPRTENPRIVMLCLVTSVQHEQPHTKDFSVRGEQGRSTWDLQLTCDQLDSGDTLWTNATQLGQRTETDVPLSLYPGGVGSDFPLLRTLEHMHRQEIPSSEIGFAYKEGSLFESDLPIVQQVAVSVDLSNYDDTSGRSAYPVRLTLNVTPNTFTPVTNQNDGGEYMRFVLLGYSVIEVPQI